MNQFVRSGREFDHAHNIRNAVESASSAAKSALTASWRRSLLFHKLDPDTASRPDRVETSILRQASDRLGRLAKIATPRLDRIFNAVGHAGCCVLFADSEGLIIEHRAMPGLAGGLERRERARAGQPQAFTLAGARLRDVKLLA